MLFQAFQVTFHGFPDVGHGLGARVPLGNAPRQRGTRCHEDPVLVLFEQNAVLHQPAFYQSDTAQLSTRHGTANIHDRASECCIPLDDSRGSVDASGLDRKMRFLKNRIALSRAARGPRIDWSSPPTRGSKTRRSRPEIARERVFFG